MTIDTKELDAKLGAFGAGLRSHVGAALREATSESLARISGGAYFQSRTGRTAQSFTASVRDFDAAVRSQSRIAVFLDQGTAPHTIVAKRAKALRFMVNGSVVFARSVRHPGTAPRGIERGEAALAELSLPLRIRSAAESAAHDAGLG